MTKILMILTSHQDLESKNSDKTTGVRLGEFTDPYFKFTDKEYKITLTSPKGGALPGSSLPANRKYYSV